MYTIPITAITVRIGKPRYILQRQTGQTPQTDTNRPRIRQSSTRHKIISQQKFSIMISHLSVLPPSQAHQRDPPVKEL